MREKDILTKVLIIIGAITAICGIVYAIYRFVIPRLNGDVASDLDEAFGPDEDEDEIYEDEEDI